MNGVRPARVTVVLLACLALGCRSVPGRAPSNAAAPGGCSVDVWIISWNADDAGTNDEDEAIANTEVHEHVAACSYADAIGGWLERAPKKVVKKPDKDYDFSPDFRVIVRLTSSHGTDLLGVSGNCDWVRRNRKQYVEYDPSLFKILKQPLGRTAERELDTYLSHADCGPPAVPR
jgi:hypothetical protein